MGETFATFHHKVVFISDLHLGSGKTASPYLYEYLKNLDFDTLERIYLVGDIVGGWEMRNRKQGPLPEMERRILDILNYAAGRGIHLHIIPGNHDEKLRPLIEKLQKRHSNKTFPAPILFEQHSYYETEGPEKKRLKATHGDQFDPQMFVKPWLRPLTFLVSAIYDGMVLADQLISGFLYRQFGVHTSFAKRLKNAFKKTVKTLYSHDQLLGGLENTDYDGIIMGHTHMAGIHVFRNSKGKDSYLINVGDWVESSTCAYVDDKTQLPKILNYKTMREELGFGDLPDEEDEHPQKFMAHRAVTNRQVRMIHKLWPAYDRNSCVKKYLEAEQKITLHCDMRKKLEHTLDIMKATNELPQESRKTLEDIMTHMKRSSYDPQKKKISDLFSTYAVGEKLKNTDLLTACTIVREFCLRAERKARKHKEKVISLRQKLDHVI